MCSPKKVWRPSGKEVSIRIKYHKLFKHCSYCGLLSHEVGYSKNKEDDQCVQSMKSGVFSRVQLLYDTLGRQSLLRDRDDRDHYQSQWTSVAQEQ